MNETREQEALRLISMIWNNYPQNPGTTFGHCCIDGCNNSARGKGVCAQCVTDELSELCGKSRAYELHRAIKAMSRAHRDVMEAVEDEI